ncbi:MAG: monosaccharide transporter ATP-binding protein family [Conexibacter sp.]|nr:monosaccharide transporter ATP-binding protein family [Conexibacter sp.]
MEVRVTEARTHSVEAEVASRSPTAVAMRRISMSFGGVRALEDVDFDVRWGEVHALLGENGAGKSTLMKILEGVYRPDSGEILVEGKPVSLRSADDARAHGIAMVFQEFSLVPTLTVAQNVLLGNERKTRLGLLDDRAAVETTSRIFEEMNVDLDPRAEIGALPAGYWQITEIAKALSQHARILVLDEPTASLTKDETQALFDQLRVLRAAGIAIVYISHRMAEIYDIADRITVMRDGRKIRTDTVAQFPVGEVISEMLGRAAERQLRRVNPQTTSPVHDPAAPPLLQIRGLHSANGINGLDLEIRAGEIVGLAGLMGSGRSELVRAVFGIDKVTAGTISVAGREVKIRNPRDAIEAGLALVPEDRRVEGLVLAHTVEANTRLPTIAAGWHGWLATNVGDQLAQKMVERLDVRTSSVRKPVGLLSGGNQQKVVIGKWLLTEPEVFMLDEPTAGIDIGAKLQIIETLRQFADGGKAVLVISSELQELLEISDRIVVLRDGRADRELTPDEFESEEALHRALQGV